MISQRISDRLMDRIDQLYDRVGNMPNQQRILACVLICFLIIGSWYYFSFTSIRNESKIVEKDYIANSKKLEGFKTKAESFDIWNQKIFEVKDAFENATRALPDKLELPTLLNGISLAGSRSGVVFVLFQLDPEVDRDFYKEIPISLKVEGRYSQMGEFFYQVANLNRIVNIRNMTMVQKKSAPEIIEMNCRVVTYMFSEGESRKTAKSTKRKKKDRI